MEAIKTHYNGMWLDSRTEARWAVFFDQLGISYIHEPEGFVFSDGTTYLPDFYLPDSNQFFECKGIMNDKDLHKINMLMAESGRPVIIGYSDFSFESCENDWGDGFYRATKQNSVLVHCPCCQKWYFSGIEGFYVCLCCGAYDGDHYFDIEFGNQNGYGWTSDKVKRALDCALSKKFDKREIPNDDTLEMKRLQAKKNTLNVPSVFPDRNKIPFDLSESCSKGVFSNLNHSFFDDLREGSESQ